MIIDYDYPKTGEHYTYDILHHDLSAQKVVSALKPKQMASLNRAYTPNVM